MTKNVLYYNSDDDAIQFKESGLHVASRHNKRWICQPEKAVGPGLSSKLFMAMSYIHELRWGTPETVVNSLQMLVDFGDIALTKKESPNVNMSIVYNEYSDSIRLMPQNYQLIVKDFKSNDWICEPDAALPHDIALKAFLLLQMKDGLKTTSGQDLAGRIDHHTLRKSKDPEAEVGL